MDTTSIILISIQIGTLFVAIFTARTGIRVYKEGQKVNQEAQRLKRKEILFLLTDELDKSQTMEYARSIVDNRVVRFEKWKKSTDAYDVLWEDIRGDYRPLKDLLKEIMGLNWIENQQFIKYDGKDVVIMTNQDSFLSIITDQKLPYRVDVKTLDRTIMLEDKLKYRHLYYIYASVIHKEVIELGYFYHRSNARHFLKKHNESPIMDKGEEEIRRSFDSVLRFLERFGYVDKNLGLTAEELGFFRAFVLKMADVDGIDEYIDHYKFNLEKLRA